MQTLSIQQDGENCTVRGNPRRKCKDCGYNFTQGDGRVKENLGCHTLLLPADRHVIGKEHAVSVLPASVRGHDRDTNEMNEGCSYPLYNG